MTELKRATASRDHDHFPEDLMDGILVRLPSPCLRLFLCVSKSWYRLLSNPNFIYRHLFFIHNDYRRRVPDDIMSRIPIISRDTNLRYCSLSRDSSCSRIEVETPFRDLPLPTVAANPSVFKSYYHEPPIVMGACGGLICVRYTGFHRNRIGLFDPATSEMKLLLPRVNDDEFPTHWIAFGFGFDGATGEYKVVRVRKLSAGHAGNRTSSIHVWSSVTGGGSWRKVEHDRGVDDSTLPLGLSDSREEIPQHCPAVRLGGRKGKCFWAGWRTTHLIVVSFDMAREALEVKTLATPRCCDDDDEHRLPKIADQPVVFMLKEETLAIFQLHVHGYSNSLDIWVLLNNVGESWSKLFSIPTTTTTSWSSIMLIMRPIGLSREGEVILWGRHAPAAVHVLDPTTGQMYALPIGASQYHVQQLATYVPMEEVPLFG
ncbi:unnamed protein product [Linum trigynum]|uniref:F-box associated beta-propeller type 3 domain-containing protein n=1 Tax=Linum trigynum TaxID=586398 RepID=A0AAV2F0D5_9ROSI